MTTTNTHSRRFRRKALAGALSAAGAIAAPAMAQEVVLEEILVTASAREQSMMDIPYNISAMSGNELEAQQITDQADLLRAISGVSVVDRGYRNSGTVNSIIIRGLNVDSSLNGDVSLNAVPTVSTYVDNTPLFANFVLRDIERVEVLRGPQGTLYGSGSLGGTVRYITRKPNPAELEGQISGTYSQTEGSEGDNTDLYGMINVPIGDSVALRASMGRIDNDGVIDYVNAYRLNEFGEPMIDTGGGCISPRDASDQQVLFNDACYTNEEDADDVEIEYVRAALGWDISDRLHVRASYHHQEDEVGARRATTLGDNNQPVDSPLYQDYGDHESGQVLLEPSSREVDLFSLDLEWDLGFATLTSNSSWYDHEGVGDADNGGLWVGGGEEDPEASRDWITAFGYSGWPRPAQRAERGYEDDTFVQELRLVSNESVAGFDWLVGAFYMDQDLMVYQNSWNPGMNAFNEACRATGDPVCDNFWPRFYSGLTERDFEYRRDVQFEEMAVYGDLTYNFSDTLRATIGARWFDNETVNDTIMGFPLVEGWTSSEVPQSKDDDSDILLKLNVSWDVNDAAMVYGTVSEGYRRGGANAIPSFDNGDNFGEPNAEAIRTYDKDTVVNYELGVKGRLDSVTYSASAFYVQWNDPQLNTTSDWYGFFLAANGDEASTQGIELELDGYLGNSLHYRLGYTYVQGELDEDFISPQSGNVVAPSGSTLPGTPENVFSGALDNTWELDGDWSLVGRVNAYFQSEAENFINQDSVINETHDSFWLFGASLSLVSANWDVTLYGKNLGDEEGVTGSFPAAYWSYDTGVFENWYGNGNRQMIVQPRTIGLTANYRF
ncbi:TonB-dependent receptor [Parahaliea mediterranea]|uniref:TonB-dependent receptor n=1 Tax=Parahaliea mediterranea TaxID=651086 RepID=A0A939IJI7_9GAMM|nr:TonB-dependent receptor [Parahaliea mediterranea]MBN7796336.1 TonB-dependent receptor [Parahaliea mediterranea]